MANDFLQNLAALDGYSRDPMTGAISQPGAQPTPLFQNPPVAKTLMAQDPQAVMLQALQQMAQKRKDKKWPDSGATVVHPGTGEVLSTDVAAVRD